jgi:hypothetical protein
MFVARQLMPLIWGEEPLSDAAAVAPEIYANPLRTLEVDGEQRVVRATWEKMDSARFAKDPDATLDYSVEWEQWLPPGDEIVTSAWSVPNGLTWVSEQLGWTLATVVVSGGVLGETYEVVNRVTTALGKADDRSILLTMRHR